MNYRHAFHAGNFADVLKHIVLSRVLAYLVQKPAPLRFIDTHAGLGWYDLAGAEAARTGEWQQGIGRLTGGGAIAEPDAALLAPYLSAVGPCDPLGMPLAYPGSPAIAADILRSGDRMLLGELHPADASALRAAMKADRRAKVIAGDGYRLLKAAVPPPERRGLVLIDPPFESRSEFLHIANAFSNAFRKWPTGIYLLWYPIKDPEAVSEFHRTLMSLALPSTLEIELMDDNQTGTGLRGSGLFIVNPPFTLRAEAAQLLPFLAARLATPERRWVWRLDGVSN